VIGTLRTADVEGLRWIGHAREEPEARFAQPPVLAQRFKQAWRQQRVTILASFALNHPDAHAIWCAVDVGDAQCAHFGDPQSGRVGGHQQGARAQVAR